MTRAGRLILGILLVATALLPLSSRVRSILSSKGGDERLANERLAKLRSLQKSLVAIEQDLGPAHQDTAKVLSEVAKTFIELAQPERAVPLLQRALAIREGTLGQQARDTAWTGNDLAAAYVQLARYEEALPLQHRSLAILERIGGPLDPETALALSNLAATLTHLSQYETALPLQERSLAAYEAVRGPMHLDTAYALNGLAAINSLIAQHHRALPLLQRSLAIHEEVLGPDHAGTASTMNRLASTYAGLGQHANALPLLKRSLATHERVLGKDHLETARTLRILADTYLHLAATDEALPLLRRSLDIRERVLGPDHPETAVTLNSLAGAYFGLANYEKAFVMQQRALLIDERIYGPRHPATGRDWYNLAHIQSKLGQSNAAIFSGKHAVNALQSTRTRVAVVGAIQEQSYANYFSFFYTDLAIGLTAMGRISEAQLVLDMLKEDEQFDFIRRSESADPRSTRIGYNATEQAWMNRYRQVANQLATLGVEEQALKKQAKLGLSAEQKRREQDLAADLRVAQLAFESFLKEMRDSFASQGPQRAAEVVETSVAAARELQDLIKGLDHGAVLLQYYITEDKVGMLLTTPGVQLARSSKVNAKDLNRQIAEFGRLLRDPKADLLKPAQALYQLLVAPVAQDLEQAGAKTVMLSLDGALRYLPFGALHDGQRYLVERWSMPMYTTVTKNRLRDAVAPRWQAAGLGVTRKQGEFGPLPAVKEEMRGIVKAAGGGVLPGEVHLDEAFTAVRLRDVSQRPFQLLHVASHFRFSPGTEVNSFLLLGDGEHLSLGDIRTQNYRFDNVDLLTLSACDTGLGGGRDAQGREIEGFGVIAQQQGAKAVLATLWPVADQSTAILMAEMYRRRQSQNLTKIEALRQAQLSLLAQSRYAHPFYWAPFILMGNWK